MKFLIILALVSALVTLGILLYGVTTMGKEGDLEAKKRSNKLMQARVAAQAITLLLLFIIALMASQG